jgi:beta-glucosidase
VGQVPVHYNHKNTGRPPKQDDSAPIGSPLDPKGFYSGYVDCPRNALLPFGFGLTYTSFDYANLTVSPEVVGEPLEVTVTVDVQNTGSREGTEVVQLYIRDPAASATRPVKELKVFRRVHLAAGEAKTVRFVMGPGDLALWDADMRYVVEPGQFEVFVGPNSVQVLKGTFCFQADECLAVES